MYCCTTLQFNVSYMCIWKQQKHATVEKIIFLKIIIKRWIILGNTSFSRVCIFINLAFSYCQYNELLMIRWKKGVTFHVCSCGPGQRHVSKYWIVVVLFIYLFIILLSTHFPHFYLFIKPHSSPSSFTKQMITARRGECDTNRQPNISGKET